MPAGSRLRQGNLEPPLEGRRQLLAEIVPPPMVIRTEGRGCRAVATLCTASSEITTPTAARQRRTPEELFKRSSWDGGWLSNGVGEVDSRRAYGPFVVLSDRSRSIPMSSGTLS